jgi:cell division protein FtsA
MVSRRLLAEILRARTDEFLELVRESLRSCDGYHVASAVVVLTGGGALLNGLDRLAETVWGLPVRIGSPIGTDRFPDAGNNPGCATGAGLVLYGFEALPVRLYTRDAVTGMFAKVKYAVKEIFKIKKGGIEYVRN